MIPANKIRIILGGDDHQRYLNMARTGTLLKKLREKSREAGELLVYLSPGDSNQGSSTEKQWELDTEFRCRLAPLLGTIGNHETYIPLNIFIDTLIKKDTSAVRIPPYLISNLDVKVLTVYQDLINKGFVITKPYIHEEQGIKIGFIGIGPENSSCEQKHGFTVDDKSTYEIVKNQSQELKSQGVNIIVVISHRGSDWDYKLAEQDFSNNIDLILGGHDHVSRKSKDENTIKHNDGSETVIANAGAYGQYLSSLCLEKKPDGRFKVSDYDLLPTDTYAQGQDLVDLVKQYKGENYFSVLFPMRDKYLSRKKILEDLADAVRQPVCAQVGIIRDKEMRFGYGETIDTVSSYDLETILPYQGSICCCELSGAQLIELMEANESCNNGLTFSGLRKNSKGQIEIEAESYLWCNIRPEYSYTIALSTCLKNNFRFPILKIANIRTTSVLSLSDSLLAKYTS